MSLTKNFSVFFLLTPLLVSSSWAVDRQVSVSGSCIRQVTTDRGVITLTADIRDTDLKSAIKKASRQYDRALEAIKKLKLDNADIKTSEYEVGEIREWEKNKSVFKGYRARVGMTVSTSEIQRLSEVMEIATREEMRDVGGLTTFLSDEKIRKEQDLCLKEAAEHAREKAEKLATSLGTGIGRVLTINESNLVTPTPRPPIPMMMMRMDKSAEESAPSAIQGGKQEISATVNATFELK